MAHCDRCDAYEQAVMSRSEGEDLAVGVVACDAFVMSDAFREWAVSRMRREVGGLVAAAGLDRMALLKSRPKD